MRYRTGYPEPSHPGRSSIGLLATVLMWSTTAAAAELTLLQGITGGGKFNHTQQPSHTAEPSRSLGLILAWDSEPAKAYELSYSRQRTKVPSETAPMATPLQIEYLLLGGSVFYAGQQRAWSPYVAGGLGVARMSPQIVGNAARLFPALALGWGMRWAISSNLALRLELRGYGMLMHSNSTLICDRGCDLRIQGDALYQLQGNLGVALQF